MSIKSNIIMDQGSTFETVIVLLDNNGDPLDVTGLTARAQMRKHYTSTNAVNFSTSLANGSLTLGLSSTQTSNIASGRFVYDVEIVDASNNVTRLVEGIVSVMPEVTRI